MSGIVKKKKKKNPAIWNMKRPDNKMRKRNNTADFKKPGEKKNINS